MKRCLSARNERRNAKCCGGCCCKSMECCSVESLYDIVWHPLALPVKIGWLTQAYPGWPQVRGSEINRSAVGFQLILLVDFVRARPLLYSYCYTMLQLFTRMASPMKTQKPSLMKTNKPSPVKTKRPSPVKTKKPRAVKTKKPTPLTCEDFLEVLRAHLDFELPCTALIIFDKKGQMSFKVLLWWELTQVSYPRVWLGFWRVSGPRGGSSHRHAVCDGYEGHQGISHPFRGKGSWGHPKLA